MEKRKEEEEEMKKKEKVIENWQLAIELQLIPLKV